MLPPKRSNRGVANSSKDTPHQRNNNLKPATSTADISTNTITSTNTGIAPVTDDRDALANICTEDPDNNPVEQQSPLAPNSKRRERKKLAVEQLHALEQVAIRTKYPSLDARRQLSTQLHLNVKVVSAWFQNRRRSASNAIERHPFRPVDADNRTDEVDSPKALDHANVELWQRLPSSSPDRGHISTTFILAERSSSSYPTMPKKASLEWACDRSQSSKRLLPSKNASAIPSRRNSANGTQFGKAVPISSSSVSSVNEDYRFSIGENELVKLQDVHGSEAVDAAVGLLLLRRKRD